MPVTAFVAPKLRTVKTLLDKCLKSHVSEGQFDMQHGKRAQALFTSLSQNLHHIH